MASDQSKVNKITESGEEEYRQAAKDAGPGTENDIDSVLDAIDEVLEAHTEAEAEAFINSYIQRADNKGVKREVSLV